MISSGTFKVRCSKKVPVFAVYLLLMLAFVVSIFAFDVSILAFSSARKDKEGYE